jgi:hypothetical protein
MRTNSAIDIKNEAMIFSAIISMTVGAPYLTASMDFSLQLSVIGYAAVLLASGFLLWFLIGTYYELRGKYLFCRCGPFTEKIMYDDIVSLRLSKNTFSSLALSSKRIIIEWYDDGIYKETMISPKNRVAFMALLMKRCRYLENAA